MRMNENWKGNKHMQTEREVIKGGVSGSFQPSPVSISAAALCLIQTIFKLNCFHFCLFFHPF